MCVYLCVRESVCVYLCVRECVCICVFVWGGGERERDKEGGSEIVFKFIFALQLFVSPRRSCDTNAQNVKGHTPLHYCYTFG